MQNSMQITRTVGRFGTTSRRHITNVTVGINDADILEERIMTCSEKPRTNIPRRNLLIAAALSF
jgi:hypothetical protein